MHSFRFNIRQLLLLFLLLGLIGGLLSAVFQRPYQISFSAMDVLGETEIALAGPGSLVLIDLNQSRMGKRRQLGSYRNTFSDDGPKHLKYVGNDRLLFLRESGSAGYRDLIYYTLSDQQVAGQVVLPSRDWQNDFSDFGSALVSVKQSAKAFSFYELNSGRRVNLQLPIELGDVQRLATGPNKEKVGLIREGDAATIIEVWNFKQQELIARWERPANGIRFLAGGSRLLVTADNEIALLDIPTQVTVWSERLNFELAPESLQVSPTGSLFAISGVPQNDYRIEVRQVDNGQLTQTFSVRANQARTKRLIRFVGDNQLAISPLTSDLGVTMLDIPSGGSHTIGRFYRWPIAVAFTIAFVLWSWCWARWARPNEERIQRAELLRNSHNGHRSDKPLSLDSSQSPHLAATSQPDRHPDENQHEESNSNLAFNLMAAGGVVAIAWSVIPMFFFGFGTPDSFLHQLFFFRVGVALFGLAVGLLSASRGFGRIYNWANLTAGLQILNLIGFDLLNFVFGICELYLLNRNQPVKVAKLVQPIAELAD